MNQNASNVAVPIGSSLPGRAPRSPSKALWGPGALVAVGYMDPGNWATAISAGARYGYALLFVVTIASLVAMLLQAIAARIGVVTGCDLAQLCRDRLPRRSVLPLWIASEVAIVACDIAEVIGSAVALQLLFDTPMWLGVLIAAAATLGFFAVKRHSDQALALLVAVLILVVGVCLAAQLAAAHPDWNAVGRGLIPRAGALSDSTMLWLAAGIVGATVMPHNLYLHSALVKHHSPRAAQADGTRTPPGGHPDADDPLHPLHRLLRRVGLDSAASLSFAFLVNAALLVLAGAVFHAHGMTEVDDFSQAYKIFSTTNEARWPGMLFASALLICGLNSMLSGTLAGQVVMEGFLRLKMSIFKRALLTRGLAVGPAMLAVTLFGERGSAQLMVASQVLLSLQLPFAMIPMLYFACDPAVMGSWRLRRIAASLAWTAAAALTVLSGLILWQLAF